MSTKFDPDPPHKWRRKLYDEAPLRKLDYKKDEDRRKGSEIETNRDLEKPMEQLVCDVHEETHDPNRNELANLAGAQKRMVSMMARVAKSSNRASFWMIILTVAITGMTAALLLFTYWLWQDAKDTKAAREHAMASPASVAPIADSTSTSTPSVDSPRQVSPTPATTATPQPP